MTTAPRLPQRPSHAAAEDTVPTLEQRVQAVLMQASNVPSPCISVCRMDAAAQWCTGCWRSLEEIAAWSRLDDAAKRHIWADIVRRSQHSPSTAFIPEMRP